MSDITLKAILSGDASSFNSAVSSAADMVSKWREETAQAAAVGQRFEESLKSQGVSIDEWARAMQAAEEKAKGVHEQSDKLQEIFANALGVGAALTGFGLLEGALDKAKEALEALTFGSMEYAHATEIMAAKLGMTTDQVQRLQYAADISGGNVSSLARSILNMQAGIESGSTKVLAALDALHLDQQEMASAGTDEAINKISTAIQGLDANSQRIDLKNLLGRGAIENITLLTGNLKELEGQADSTGAVLEKETLEQLADNEKAWIAVKDAVAGFTHALGGLIGMTGVGTWLSDMAGGIGFLTEKIQLLTEMTRKLKGGEADTEDLKHLFSFESYYKSPGKPEGPAGKDYSRTGTDDENKDANAAAMAVEARVAKEAHKQAAKEAAEAWRTFEYQMELLRSEEVITDKEVAKEKVDEAKVALDMQTQFAKELVAGMERDSKIEKKLQEEKMKDEVNAAEFGRAVQARQVAEESAMWETRANFVRSFMSLLSDLGVSANSMIASVLGAVSQGMDIVSRSVKQGYLSLQDMMSAAGSIFSTGKNKGSGAGALSGAMEGGEIGAMFGPQGAVIGAVAGGVIGAIGGLFHHETEAEKIGKELGGIYSDNLAKAIADTESKDKVSRALAEALHVDDMLKESGADPSTMAGTINTLMEATASGAVPAADGVAELGKAFNDLKTAADGGSVASEAAMVKMIQRAKELGIHIPELDAAVGKMLDDAMAGLHQFYQGLAPGAGGKGQGAASQQLFGALYAAQAQTGMAEAYDKYKDLFAEMKKSLAPGTKLTGDAAEFARLEKLMENKEFSGAARGAEGLAKATTGLMDSGNLSQRVVDAVGKSLETLYDQALGGAHGAGLKGSKADDAALKAVLPELVALQRAQALGAHLTPKETEMLAQAQAKHLLPMLDVATQQLLTQKQIERNTSGGGGSAGYGPRGGAGSPYHAAAGFYSPSMPAGPMAGGGTALTVHPGERVSVTQAGGVSGGGRSGGMHISTPVTIHAGTIIGDPNDLVGVITDALRSRHPDLLAAVQLATNTN